MSATLFYLLLSLLIWTPLAFGSVHALSYSLLALHAFLLAILFIVQAFHARRQPDAMPAFVWTPIAIPLVLFLALVTLQLLPLPPYLLRLISPSTEALYRLFLPDWPNTWMPLSLNRYTTQIALVKLLAYTCVFFLVVNTVRTRQHMRKLSWVIVAVATGMALIGIAQKFSDKPAIYWFFEVSHYVGNFFGPYVNGNHFAAYEVMAIMLGLGMLLLHEPHSRDRGGRAWRQPLRRVFALERMLLVVCLLVMVSALVLSQSRGGVVAFLFGLIGLAVLLRFRQRSGQRRKGFLIVFMVFGVVTLLFGGPLLVRFLQMFTGQEVLPWGGGRLAVYQATWNMAKDFPLFGIGFEAFVSVFPRYQQPAALPQSYVHAHNDVLQLLAETGGVGFALAVIGVVVGSVSILKRWRQRHDPFVQVMVAACLAACLAIGAHSLVDFNLHIPANALVATTILALAFAGVNVARHREPVDTDVTMPSGIFGRLGSQLAPWAALGIILWLSVVAVRVAVADLLYPQQRSSNQLHWTHKGSFDLRLDRLEQALQWTPNNPVYFINLADLSIRVALDELKIPNLSDEARQKVIEKFHHISDLYYRALRQSPTEPEAQVGWLRNLQILRSLNDPAVYDAKAPMTQLCERVATLAPAYANIQYSLGEVLLFRSDDDGQDSLPYFRNSIRLNEEFVQLVWYIYQRTQTEAEALQLFAKVMPNTAQGHLKIAKVLEKSHWQQARLHYRTAMVLSRSDPDVIRVYAEALMRHKDFKGAQSLWERYIERVPDQADAYLRLASTARALKDGAGEVHALEKAVTLQPNSPSAYSHLARLYEKHGHRDKALEAYLKLTRLQPNNAELMFKVGEHYHQDGESQQALRYYRRAVALKPNQARFRQRLEKALQRPSQ